MGLFNKDKKDVQDLKDGRCCILPRLLSRGVGKKALLQFCHRTCLTCPAENVDSKVIMVILVIIVVKVVKKTQGMGARAREKAAQRAERVKRNRHRRAKNCAGADCVWRAFSPQAAFFPVPPRSFLSLSLRRLPV